MEVQMPVKNEKVKDWRLSREYRTWRVHVIRRDGRCVICDSIKDREAHHMNHATYWPTMRFDASNGVTLCRACHVDFHCNFKMSFREKCSKADFANFVTLVDHVIMRASGISNNYIKAVESKIKTEVIE